MARNVCDLGLKSAKSTQVRWDPEAPDKKVCQAWSSCKNSSVILSLNNMAKLNSTDFNTLKQYISKAQHEVASEYRRRYLSREYAKKSRLRVENKVGFLSSEIRRYTKENKLLRKKINCMRSRGKTSTVRRAGKSKGNKPERLEKPVKKDATFQGARQPPVPTLVESFANSDNDSAKAEALYVDCAAENEKKREAKKAAEIKLSLETSRLPLKHLIIPEKDASICLSNIPDEASGEIFDPSKWYEGLTCPNVPLPVNIINL